MDDRGQVFGPLLPAFPDTFQGGPGFQLILSLWLLTFADGFPSLFQEAASALRVFNMLNTHIYTCSLDKNLALDLFVYNYANSMLGSIV